MIQYRINGQVVSRKSFMRGARGIESVPMTTPPGCWPRWSDAAGIHPNQVDEARQSDLAQGVSAEYCRKTGQVKFESRRHEKQCLEAWGLYHLNGGYQDARRPADIRK